MAWALQFDGANDYAESTSWTPTTNNWRFKFVLIPRSLAPSNSVPLSNGTHLNGIYVNYNASLIYLRCGGQAKAISVSVDTEYTLELVSVSGVVSFYMQEQDLGSESALCNPSLPLNFGRRVENSSQNAICDIILAEFIDDANSSNSRRYDATASDHSNTGVQPVLVDTIGGNNATGVNMPTDGSAWVDLGGGGGVTGDLISILDNNFMNSLGQIGSSIMGELNVINLGNISSILGRVGENISGTSITLLQKVISSAQGTIGSNIIGILDSTLSTNVLLAIGKVGANINGQLIVTSEGSVLTSEGTIGYDVITGTIDTILINTILESSVTVGSITGNLINSLENNTLYSIGDVFIIEFKEGDITLISTLSIKDLNLISPIRLEDINIRGAL